MELTKLSCETFVEQLATKEPVPGGGGASAMVGALGTALGNMVGSLTVGKKKYAAVEEDIIRLKKQADDLQAQLLALVEEDAEAFAPLARAYGLPKDTEEQRTHKAQVMEAALKEASRVPLEIMELCCKAIMLCKDFAAKGSVIAVSDAGVGVAFCKAALQGASLNVFINTKAMQDKACAEATNQKANAMLAEYTALADEVYESVRARLN